MNELVAEGDNSKNESQSTAVNQGVDSALDGLGKLVAVVVEHTNDSQGISNFANAEKGLRRRGQTS